MSCRYDPEQDFRQAALIVGLCLGAAILSVAVALIIAKPRIDPAPLPPEPECWEIPSGKPCADLHQEPRAVRSRR